MSIDELAVSGPKVGRINRWQLVHLRLQDESALVPCYECNDHVGSGDDDPETTSI